jgi:hypothetical protein
MFSVSHVLAGLALNTQDPEVTKAIEELPRSSILILRTSVSSELTYLTNELDSLPSIFVSMEPPTPSSILIPKIPEERLEEAVASIMKLEEGSGREIRTVISHFKKTTNRSAFSFPYVLKIAKLIQEFPTLCKERDSDKFFYGIVEEVMQASGITTPEQGMVVLRSSGRFWGYHRCFEPKRQVKSEELWAGAWESFLREKPLLETNDLAGIERLEDHPFVVTCGPNKLDFIGSIKEILVARYLRDSEDPINFWAGIPGTGLSVVARYFAPFAKQCLQKFSESKKDEALSLTCKLIASDPTRTFFSTFLFLGFSRFIFSEFLCAG